MDQRDVRAAWERFVERGALASELRSPVANSWQRSRGHQVAINRDKAPLAAEAELFRQRAKHVALRHAARNALENSRTFLSDAHSIMILTDPSGLIIDTEGDARVIDAGRAVHLEHGGRWSEADIGTNAIGAAMAEARPVQIHGAEHFCAEVQRWTCAAVPVRDPVDGEVLGIVDISGPATTFNPHSLALAVCVGQQVESVLARAIKENHERLLQHYVAKRALWTTDDCLLIDRRGTILHGSELARRAIRDNARSDGHDPPTRILKRLDFAEWPAKLKELIPGASVDLVAHDDTGIGAVIVLHARRRPAGSERGLQKQDQPDNRRMSSGTPRPAPPPGLRFCEEPAAKRPLCADAAPRRARPSSPATSFVAADPIVQAVVRRVEVAAARQMPILIRGETGTGKEQLARHAHAASGRKGAFVPVNCAALPESLIEAELFGYAEGAFTGARRGGAPGLVQEADGGTLFLDEIGDMPVALQAVLLRLIDDWTVRPVGGARSRVDIFLVSATNAGLEDAVAQGRFRSDLLYRLNTLEVTLPRLRDRTDFESIVRRLIDDIDPGCEIAAPTMAALAARAWPGNIRELRNILARLALAGGDGPETSVIADLIGQAPPAKSGSLQDMQLASILAVHAETAGNVSETARRLGVSRNTVYRALGQTAPR
ncbi:sigma-54-dependent Fis family transcriptional regulator [Rhodopseudomonas palustris]|uniref:sigma-54-dependent Fis family transcriptional regulator n=1 Tax=Rhodopseudomonas palustris TaxID=1076 RepID=UPI0020CE1EA6|nr:sigma-54-dependent Fis family transcriptional regulator [Rhodopseudomonas palustris]MCP9629597.1 sigma-54-dependent Fis family transcriptional regulator [Rhodopseudomonas palustris]